MRKQVISFQEKCEAVKKQSDFEKWLHEYAQKQNTVGERLKALSEKAHTVKN